MSYSRLNAHRRPRKGNKFSPEESHWFSMGKLHTGLHVSLLIPSIYINVRVSSKYITAVDLKTTLDPQQ